MNITEAQRRSIGLEITKKDPAFKTDKDVRQFKEDLIKATEEKFEEYRRAQIASWAAAQSKWLD